MSEGQHFEVPPKSHEPQSVEALLEKGEIEKLDRLEGHAVISVAKIKDDGRGLFKPESDPNWSSQKGENRNALEILAYRIDKILGFNLVPETVLRTIAGQEGSFQRFVHDSIPASAVKYPASWREKISKDELMKAAVFDYVIGASDRDLVNFLINPETGKIWLIDHDIYMFFQDFRGSIILNQAKNKKMVEVSEEITIALAGLDNSIDTLIDDAGDNVDLKSILIQIQNRTKTLLEKKTLMT